MTLNDISLAQLIDVSKTANRWVCSVSAASHIAARFPEMVHPEMKTGAQDLILGITDVFRNDLREWTEVIQTIQPVIVQERLRLLGGQMVKAGGLHGSCAFRLAYDLAWGFEIGMWMRAGEFSFPGGHPAFDADLYPLNTLADRFDDVVASVGDSVVTNDELSNVCAELDREVEMLRPILAGLSAESDGGIIDEKTNSGLQSRADKTDSSADNKKKTKNNWVPKKGLIDFAFQVFAAEECNESDDTQVQIALEYTGQHVRKAESLKRSFRLHRLELYEMWNHGKLK